MGHREGNDFSVPRFSMFPGHGEWEKVYVLFVLHIDVEKEYVLYYEKRTRTFKRRPCSLFLLRIFINCELKKEEKNEIKSKGTGKTHAAYGGAAG